MKAIEFEAKIDDNHEIHIKLPDKVTSDTAKVIVMYEEDDQKKELKKPLQFGLFRGKIHMSDDFNDPLPDSFWLEGKL